MRTKLLSITLVSLWAILLCACSEEVYNEDNQTSKKVERHLSDYKFWGDTHNEFLQNAINMNSSTRIIGDEDAHPQLNYDELNRQQIAYAQSLNMDAELKPILCEGLQEMSPYYDSELFYETYFVKKDGKRKIHTMIKQLRQEGSIDSFEYEVLYSISSYVAQYKEGIISLDFLKYQIDQYAIKWDDKYLFSNLDDGQTAAYVLVIAQSSLEWWSENELDTGTRAVPAWIAADAGGAIVGAVLEGAGQYIKSGKIAS